MPVSFSENDLNNADEASMDALVNDRPSGWLWVFAGPGHEKTIEQNNKSSREALHREKMQDQARVNGKKWVAPDRTPDEVRGENVSWVVGRLLRWSADVEMDGQPLPFSEDAARKLLSDPRKTLLNQAIEFLTADKAFTKRSA